ncbi:MAG: VWA domain-containing protein [Saprospiraceae bacterium]
MFRFEHPFLLWTIAFVFLMFVFFLWQTKQKEKLRGTIIHPEALPRLIVGSAKEEKRKVYFVLMALFFLCLALANPQWGKKQNMVRSKEEDLLIVMDVSQSMLAQDVLPSRLTVAKALVLKIFDDCEAERIGIVTFALNANLLMPFTTDFSATKMYIESLDTGFGSEQGTSIEAAIEAAIEQRDPDQTRPLSIVLLTDGESHEDTGISAAKSLGNKSIELIVVGVGTAEGAYIPDESGFKRDMFGNFVKSRLNEPLLQQIAKSGHGHYFNLSKDLNSAHQAILKQFATEGKTSSGRRVYEEYESRFQWFLAVGLLLLLYCLIV